MLSSGVCLILSPLKVDQLVATDRDQILTEPVSLPDEMVDFFFFGGD